jgi:hypothetical protein
MPVELHHVQDMSAHECGRGLTSHFWSSNGSGRDEEVSHDVGLEDAG